MIEAVLLFALIISVFEFIMLSMIPPRTRLRILGSSGKKMAFHIGMLLINMAVHWGTMTGTMAATLAFIMSIGVTWLAEKVFGSITDDRYYTVGLVKYSVGEIR